MPRILIILILLWSCSNQQAQENTTNKMDKTHKHNNELIHETSPYLLQHAHNPVNWYPWGKKAFELSKKENKLVLISIGYAACHWCHVMEHESFENEEIAKLMNEHFICIKVDREERPDVDQIYMSAVQLLTGSGGWPLNCFTLSDGRPVYGGTYFRPEQWTQVLASLNKTFHDTPERIQQAAEEISAGVKSHEIITIKSEVSEFSIDLLNKSINNWIPYFDTEWGGNKRAPKFALPIGYELLLSYNYHNNNQQITDQVDLTLEKMAHGGIYDQVGGGFARYSVDAKWKVPHFEKMLYDNGQLISLYSKAYKQTQNKLYKRLIEQTLTFIKREMTTNNGAFYASYDADSEGVEGKFYVWGKQELEQILGKNAEWFCEYNSVTNNGNWEHSNILWITEHDRILKKYNISQEQLFKKLDKSQSLLLKERNKRISPGLDDKTLTSWNALMSIGYFDAYEALSKKEYLNIAINNCRFIEETMLNKEGKLFRNYKNGKTTINGFLDDYALSIKLFNKAYRNTFDEHWLEQAEKLTNYVIDHFYDEKSGLFFYTSDLDPELIARKMELSDNVIPASNSIMANNLYDMSVLMSKNEWKEMALQMLANVQANMEQNIPYYANWGILLNKLVVPQFEVVITGSHANSYRENLLKNYIPNVVISGTESENNQLPLTKNRWVKNETLIYVCKNNTCKLPVKTVDEALLLLK